jgi:FKBP-type peptidyl-prolyl cis-trans isomerase
LALQQVIKGWTDSLFLRGGNGISLVPAHLGYEVTEALIPGGSVLIF